MYRRSERVLNMINKRKIETCEYLEVNTNLINNKLNPKKKQLIINSNISQPVINKILPDSKTFLLSYQLKADNYNTDEKILDSFIEYVKSTYLKYLTDIKRKDTETISDLIVFLDSLKNTHSDIIYHFIEVKMFIRDSFDLGIINIDQMICAIKNCHDHIYRQKINTSLNNDSSILYIKKDLSCIQIVRDGLYRNNLDCTLVNCEMIASAYIEKSNLFQIIISDIIQQCVILF